MKSEVSLSNGNMTEGNPLKLILIFSVPLLIGNMLQQLYNVIDLIVVGNYIGKHALAAVGVNGNIIFFMSSLFTGIGAGATVLISQFYGANDLEQVRKTAKTIYSAMIFATPFLMVSGLLLSAPVLNLLNVPEDTFPMAKTYLTIIFTGFLGSLGYNINAGILQGIGDSRSSLLFLAIASILNIVFDLIFIQIFDNKIAGIALATLIAQFSSWIFGLFYMRRKYDFLVFPIVNFKIDFSLLKKIVSIGLPSAIQQSVFSIGLMSLQSLINSYGSDFIAGYNAANKIDTFSFMPIQSFAIAVSTFIGQNIGAQKMDRVKTGIISTLKVSISFSIIAAFIIVPFGPNLLSMFNKEPAVIEAGMLYLKTAVPFFWILSVTFTLNSVLRGAGQTIVPMLSSALSLWLIRIPVAYYIANTFGKEYLFYSYIIGWFFGMLITSTYFISGKWKNKALKI